MLPAVERRSCALAQTTGEPFHRGERGHRHGPRPLSETWGMDMVAGCITGAEFKFVMRRFAACVNVITMNGMTATAVCSVTAEPPSVLAIINRSNRSHPLISRSGVFAINVLASEQEHVAVHFASKADDPFSTVEHRRGVTGCPLIRDADAYLECEVAQETDFGTHTIFIGRIIACGSESKDPLVYHEGRFRSLRDQVLEDA